MFYVIGNNFFGIYFVIVMNQGVVVDGCFMYLFKVFESIGCMFFMFVVMIDVGSGVMFVKGQWKSVCGSVMYIDLYVSLFVIWGMVVLLL